MMNIPFFLTIFKFCLGVKVESVQMRGLLERWSLDAAMRSGKLRGSLRLMVASKKSNV